MNIVVHEPHARQHSRGCEAIGISNTLIQGFVLSIVSIGDAGGF